jgi:DNA (cytosine-5)-methyltransferase 1
VRKSGAFTGLGPLTVLTGGYPCQGESFAGLRKGASDDRWLWPATGDVIKVARPAWFIGENVLGHVSMGLDTVLSDLEGLGYAAQPFVIPACAVDARHRRDRVWVVAHDDRCDGAASGSGEAQAGAANIAVAGIEPPLRTDAGRAGREEREERDLTTFADRSRHSAGLDVEEWRAWNPEPGVGGVVHGIPPRSHESSVIVQRLTGLGNAIVPQIPEKFFRWIARIERGELT